MSRPLLTVSRERQEFALEVLAFAGFREACKNTPAEWQKKVLRDWWLSLVERFVEQK